MCAFILIWTSIAALVIGLSVFHDIQYNGQLKLGTLLFYITCSFIPLINLILLFVTINELWNKSNIKDFVVYKKKTNR